MRQEGADLEREVRWPLEFVVASNDQSCVVPEVPLAEIEFGTCSRPAEIDLYLLPRDVLSSFSEGGIIRGHILRLFERFEHFVVLLRTHQDRRTPSIVLKLDRFGL